MEFSPEIIAALLAIIAALLASSITAVATVYVVRSTQRFERVQAADLDRLKRVNQQIGEFHGPMIALSNAARQLWESMAKELDRSPDSLRDFMHYDHEGNECEPSVEQLQDWKRWISNIFRPIDLARERILLEKYHLAFDDDVDPSEPLAKLVAHVAGFKELVESWEQQVTDEDTLRAWQEKGSRAFIPCRDFPKEVTEYVQGSYKALKKIRYDLLETLKS